MTMTTDQAPAFAFATCCAARQLPRVLDDMLYLAKEQHVDVQYVPRKGRFVRVPKESEDSKASSEGKTPRAPVTGRRRRELPDQKKQAAYVHPVEPWPAGTVVWFLKPKRVRSRLLRDHPAGQVVEVPRPGCAYVVRSQAKKGVVDIEERLACRARPRMGLPKGSVTSVVLNVPLGWLVVAPEVEG